VIETFDLRSFLVVEQVGGTCFASDVERSFNLFMRPTHQRCDIVGPSILEGVSNGHQIYHS